MTPQRAARSLLRLTGAAIVGYGFCWADKAWGHAPVLLLILVAAVSWLAGSAHGLLPLHQQLAAARSDLAVAERERDEIAARLAELEDGGRYVARSVLAHPSVRSKVTRLLPRQPDGTA